MRYEETDQRIESGWEQRQNEVTSWDRKTTPAATKIRQETTCVDKLLSVETQLPTRTA